MVSFFTIFFIAKRELRQLRYILSVIKQSEVYLDVELLCVNTHLPRNACVQIPECVFFPVGKILNNPWMFKMWCPTLDIPCQ